MLGSYLFFCLCAGPALADIPIVEDVEVHKQGDTWRVSVTLSHPDTGWDHYADGWGVFDANGHEIGVRVLAHPHVNKQPFTRSLSGIALPDGLDEIFIRARCNVDGWGKEAFPVQLR